jgi:hypothetical protein
MLTEKDIEKYLKDKVKKAGGIAYKFISPGNNAVPDRLVCLPWTAQIFFVETKIKSGGVWQDRQQGRC